MVGELVGMGVEGECCRYLGGRWYEEWTYSETRSNGISEDVIDPQVIIVSTECFL